MFLDLPRTASWATSQPSLRTHAESFGSHPTVQANAIASRLRACRRLLFPNVISTTPRLRRRPITGLVEGAPYYSILSVSIGSMDAALRAGTKAATMPQAVNSKQTDIIVTASCPPLRKESFLWREPQASKWGYRHQAKG